MAWPTAFHGAELAVASPRTGCLVLDNLDALVKSLGNAICLVCDRGCGIPAADQNRWFQAFHRGRNVRQIPGTGLGLLIVQRCVEWPGGEIQFESTEGQRTTFTVRLPLFGQPSATSSPPERP